MWRGLRHRHVGCEYPGITATLRGLVGEEITVKAANRDLHSGMYGGPPATRSASCRASSPKSTTMTAASPFPASTMASKKTPSQVLKSWESLNDPRRPSSGRSGCRCRPRTAAPSSNRSGRGRPRFNGISGGYTGEGFKTVIAAEAFAKISFRLVATQIRTRSARRSVHSCASAYPPIAPSSSIRMAARRPSSFPTTRRF